MKNFVKTVLAVITGIILSSVIFFFFFIMMIGVMISSGKKPVVVSDKSVLILKTGVPIPDQRQPQSLIYIRPDEYDHVGHDRAKRHTGQP
jgi:protease IV